MAEEYENYTEAGIVNTEPAKLEVPTFSKKEIEAICRKIVAENKKIDIKNYPEWDLELIPLGETVENTPERLALLQKIYEAGGVHDGDNLLLLNYANVRDGEKLEALCLGCYPNHEELGEHIEVSISDENITTLDQQL